MESARSKNNVRIRLPDERWFHITEEHAEMAGRYFEVLETIEVPTVVYQGNTGECLAVREIEGDKHLVVVYKETSQEDGFVITAYLTRRKRQLERRHVLWQL
jgi:hypothetical protein